MEDTSYLAKEILWELRYGCQTIKLLKKYCIHDVPPTFTNSSTASLFLGMTLMKTSTMASRASEPTLTNQFLARNVTILYKHSYTLHTKHTRYIITFYVTIRMHS